MNEPKQEELIPRVPPKTAPASLGLDDILSPVSSLSPSHALVESVKRYGVLDPIRVEWVDELASYRITDGRRRYLAAREAGLEEVPATVVYGDEIAQKLTSLTGHATRESNPLYEFELFEELFSRGFSESLIQQETGFSIQTIRKRMKLANLAYPLKNAVAQGLMSISVAESASTLTEDQQIQLAMDSGHGRITAKAVKAVKSAVHETAIQDTFADLLPESSESASEAPRRAADVTVYEYLEKLAEALIRANFAGDIAIGEEEGRIFVEMVHEDGFSRRLCLAD